MSFAVAVGIGLGGAPVARADDAPRGFRWYTSESFGGPRLGVQVTPMTDELRQFFGAQPDAGVLVGKVEKDTPAAQAGVRVGDVLVSVATQRVQDASDVRRALADQKEGDLVEVTVVRDKRPLVLSAKVPKAETPSYTSGPPPGMFPEGMPPMRFFGGDFDERLRKIEERLEKLEQRR
jgi:membrane-associated protease RseP (regulator of RpoE activity)